MHRTMFLHHEVRHTVRRRRRATLIRSSELKPIVVEPWDTKDEEDGLPEKSLTRNDAYFK